ncbi:MAG: universal stress protein [Acidobacteria bacterium]|nr:universal stress protein [Acidobacteriota bacterium]MBS1866654.1 universal stress protein [Acidobacteriota bacterium]
MNILVAIDNSPSSDTVLQAAAAATWPGDTTICVLNIVNVTRFERLPALIEAATRESERLVEEGAKRICKAGYEAFSRTSPGNPRSDISCFAKEWGADLILVGSHGHSAIGRFLLGSVAQGVLRTAPCSVEIVRTPPASSSSPRKVLFATDGSDCSVHAAHNVAAGLWPQRSVFKVLSVEELLVVGTQMEAASLSAVYPASLLEELTTQARDRTRSAVETAKDILLRAGLKVDDTNSMPLGEPRGVILDTAKEWGADLIVVGSHGKRGLDRFLLGSVSEAVAIHASCSVRVARERQHSKGNGRAD